MSDPWALLWDVPVLRGLDEPARRAIAAAGRVRRYEAGQFVFRAHDPADSVHVVLEGAVQLWAPRRGDASSSVLRTVRRGQTFGEGAFEDHGGRRTQATAVEPTRAAELPVALLRRALGRSGGPEGAERVLRRLKRRATADLLRTMAATRGLASAELDRVLDGVQDRSFPRGAMIYAAGDPARGLWLVVDGLVQLQTEDDERIHVQAYLMRGDGFGEDAALGGTPHLGAAVAMGPTRLLLVPTALWRSLLDRNPGLASRMRRIASARGAGQAPVVAEAAARSTQHVFKDLYRMQMARSLLVIDQDTCVRCGHCAWTCQTLYGTARLVRRGDKILTTVGSSDAPVRSLMLPNSCQHCKNPSCMVDCPTGAIGRDPRGEVFIRDSLCTGCGNCAKACPWENIRMAPRPAGSVASLSAELATKCDLCRDYEQPGCVRSCPTGSILRLDPSRDVGEVAAVLGSPRSTARARPRDRDGHSIGRGLAWAAALGGGGVAAQAQAVGRLGPGEGLGLVAGILGAIGVVALASYAIPKRIVTLWMRRVPARSAARRVAERVAERVDGRVDGRAAPRSAVRGWLSVHVGVGLVTVVAVLGHAGLRIPGGVAGSLALALWLTSGLGAFGAAVYRVLPRRLAQLERRGDLPEDLAAEREVLLDRLFIQASGRDALVKTIALRVLVPYARALYGPVVLLLSGRRLADERARLHARIDAMREGRGHERLGGLDELVRTAVDLRALPVRRGLTTLLRGWLPLHIVMTAVVLVLLGLHVALVLGGS